MSDDFICDAVDNCVVRGKLQHICINDKGHVGDHECVCGEGWEQ